MRRPAGGRVRNHGPRRPATGAVRVGFRDQGPCGAIWYNATDLDEAALPDTSGRSVSDRTEVLPACGRRHGDRRRGAGRPPIGHQGHKVPKGITCRRRGRVEPRSLEPRSPEPGHRSAARASRAVVRRCRVAGRAARARRARARGSVARGRGGAGAAVGGPGAPGPGGAEGRSLRLPAGARAADATGPRSSSGALSRGVLRTESCYSATCSSARSCSGSCSRACSASVSATSRADRYVEAISWPTVG